jgi:hypothetical protein
MKYLYAVLMALGLNAVVVAHHSPANFDLNVTAFAIKGEIKSVEFRNPHSEIVLLVKDAKGVAVEWEVEFSSVNLLVRRGWKLDRIKVGDEVTCIGNPGKNAMKAMYMWSIKLADGTEYAK